MLKSVRKILALALACSALCWAEEQMLNLSLQITKNYMVIGAFGGFSKNFYYRAAPDLYESRYISLHKEYEDDAGRIVWALYSEKNGILDSVIADENNDIYSAIGQGEGGIWPPHLKHRLTQHRNEKIVVAPLSIFDEVFKELLKYRHAPSYAPKYDTNDIVIVLDPDKIAEPNDNRENFLKKLQSYKPLIQMIKDAGFTYIDIAITTHNIKETGLDYGDIAILVQDMYKTLGLETPPKREGQGKLLLRTTDKKYLEECEKAYLEFKNQKK